MAYKKTLKILIGRKMYATGFGLRSMSKGMFFGGFEIYLFGIKSIFGIEVKKTWGKFLE